MGKKQKQLQTKLFEFQNLVDLCDDIELLSELALSEGDTSLKADLRQNIAKLTEDYEKLKLKTLLNGEHDASGAVLTIHAGSGGRDAMDWAEMLYRLYARWAERNSYKVEVLDDQRDVACGIKMVSLRISGDYAYGYLKSEHGVHRLIRISPFDSTGRRHTSFAAVDVIPDLDDDITVEIDPHDLEIDRYRASGAGGQHVNTTDSAVRITHIPTKIVVSCQNERSQLMNRETAMKMLKARLILLKEQEHRETIEELHGDYSEISWGSQIRSYVFQPYKMVKDHRTNVEVGKLDEVMDGGIDVFIQAYLAMESGDKN